MVFSISHPELLAIKDEAAGQSFFGGGQEWYSAEWGRKAGCGPTCAANLMLYLALTNPELRPLYQYNEVNRTNFVQHMEELFEFVTPGNMGLNRMEMFTDGVTAFAKSRGITLVPHTFAVPGFLAGGRAEASSLTEFVKDGLSSDCPLGFLNLTRGRVKNIQGWHWITITSADIGENRLTANASDEGYEISFNLRLWYLTTRMSGGLAYFTY